ncbi:MAG: FAD/NAD(P)-binding protein [Phycisphaeraceae bacterium]|nr:FAD/NAD(P)-binding protein [Phycisphaeraceae bacterium]
MRTLAIIGAGFGGTMTCVHLLRLLAERAREDGAEDQKPFQIYLIERSGRFTAGVAYSTTSHAHLLNVPAGRMSALPDDPDHFLRWARQQDARIGGGTFVPRPMYGRYLASILEEANAAAGNAVRLTRVPRGAAGARADSRGVTIELDGGSEINADAAVLAIGNFAPGNPPLADETFYRSWRYAKDPWGPGALDVEPDGDVLLLGTGLTMLDIAIALKERGHRGTIHAVSRRGLLPQPHRVSIRPPASHPRPKGLEEWPRTARGLLHALRAEVRGAAARGVDWREVVTSLRHDTPALWRGLSERERSRFLLRVRPYWETHRHRAAPETATQIAELIARNELVVHAGRVIGYAESRSGGGGVEARVLMRGAERETALRVARVINCTGPETDLRKVEDAFVRRLVECGVVRPDALGLGLDTDAYGAIVSADGRVQDRLMLVGPLRKGQLWENTAVPELRHETLAMAKGLAGRVVVAKRGVEVGV